MKQTLLLTLSSLSMVAFMTACTNQMASVGLSTADKTEECINIDKKLIKVDKFIEVVNNTSAFHLEEAARAIETPGITVSNNKKTMLRDANKKKAELESEHQKLGCETPKK
ncbi:MAG: hypothetical protein U9R13_08660 [Campylobacterota bacterium]|nr:hypothetical protein [Campylobacterota bacterium]